MSYLRHANAFLCKMFDCNIDDFFDVLDIENLYCESRGKSYDEKVSLIVESGICRLHIRDKIKQKQLAKALARDFGEWEGGIN